MVIMTVAKNTFGVSSASLGDVEPKTDCLVWNVIFHQRLGCESRIHPTPDAAHGNDRWVCTCGFDSLAQMGQDIPTMDNVQNGPRLLSKRHAWCNDNLFLTKMYNTVFPQGSA